MAAARNTGKSKKPMEESLDMAQIKNFDSSLFEKRQQQWKPVFEDASMSNRQFKKMKSPDRNDPLAQPQAQLQPSYPYSINPSIPLFHPPYQNHQQMISFAPHQEQYNNPSSFAFPPYFVGDLASQQQLQKQQLLQYWSDTLNLSPRGKMMMLNRSGQDPRTWFKGSKAIISGVHGATGGMKNNSEYTLAKQAIVEVPSDPFRRLEPTFVDKKTDQQQTQSDADDGNQEDRVERSIGYYHTSAIEMRIANLEQKLVQVEKNSLASKQMESKIVQRLTNVANHKFEVAKYRLNQELREGLRMNQPAEEAPKILNVNDDDDEPIQKSSEMDIEAEEVEKKIETAAEKKIEAVGEKVEKYVKKKKTEKQAAEVVPNRSPKIYRTSEGVPGTLSAYTDPNRRKKAKMEIEMIVEPLPVPFKGPDDDMIDTSRDKMLVEWIKKNNHPRKETKIGLATGCYGNGLYEYIAAHNLSKIRDDGWLDNSDLDCFLQLLMSQVKAYPAAFKSHRWTCLGSQYEKEVNAQCDVFKERRKINSLKNLAEQENKDFDWEIINDQLYKFVMGANENWDNKPWSEVDFVYGVQNIENCHWAAFEYDLKEKVINVYDSMLTSLQPARKKAFDKHATILPGLVNLFCEKKEEKLNLDEPFQIRYIDCPQQQNGHACGVYALKFIQCLCMGDSIWKLKANRFPSFRKKILQDLLKWKISPDSSKIAFEEVTYGMHAIDGIEETRVHKGENICEIHIADGIEATPLVHQGEDICEMYAADGTGETSLVPHVVDGTEATHVHQGENISSNLFVVGTRPVAKGDNNGSTNTKPSKRRKKENKIQISLDQKQQSGKPLKEEASKSLGVHKPTRSIVEGDNNGSTKPSKPRNVGKKIKISLDQLEQQYGNTLEEASRNLGVCESTIKRRCREYKIERWPFHENNKANPSLFMKQNPNEAPHIVSSEADSTDVVLPIQTPIHSTHELQTVQHQAVSYRDSEADKIVTIKASYGHSAFIKFKLSSRSTLQDLQEQVSKRLKWEANRFEIKYQDEANDWITITIDDDLKDCLQASIDRSESTVSMSINLRLD